MMNRFLVVSLLLSLGLLKAESPFKDGQWSEVSCVYPVLSDTELLVHVSPEKSIIALGENEVCSLDNAKIACKYMIREDGSSDILFLDTVLHILDQLNRGESVSIASTLGDFSIVFDANEKFSFANLSNPEDNDSLAVFAREFLNLMNVIKNEEALSVVLFSPLKATEIVSENESGQKIVAEDLEAILNDSVVLAVPNGQGFQIAFAEEKALDRQVILEEVQVAAEQMETASNDVVADVDSSDDSDDCDDDSDDESEEESAE